jgi:hypothetical protein
MASHAVSPASIILGVIINTQTIFRSLRLGRFHQLLDDVKFDLCDPTSNHPKRNSRRM